MSPALIDSLRRVTVAAKSSSLWVGWASTTGRLVPTACAVPTTCVASPSDPSPAGVKESMARASASIRAARSAASVLVPTRFASRVGWSMTRMMRAS